MDYYQLISAKFQNSMETIARTVDEVAQPIAAASEMMVSALLADRKIVVCGNGCDGAIAQLFACHLLSSLEQERPALPALALNADGASITAIATNNGLADTFARQVMALGQAGDVLLCITSGGDATNLSNAVQAAQDRNMPVIALATPAASDLANRLQEGDLAILVDDTRRPQVVEVHTMTVHCLCQLVEQNLFGNYA